MTVLEPATEAVLAEIPRAGVEEADAAVARAKAAYPGWRAIAPPDRAKLLFGLADALEARKEELAVLEARNAGKPIGDARGEMGMVVDTFRFYAGAVDKHHGETIHVDGGVDLTFREPLGVCGLIATGWAEPGEAIEAIEMPERRWALGILWHAEEDPQSPVLAGLTGAARTVAA